MSQDMIWLFSGLAIFLSVASLIGKTLQLRSARAYRKAGQAVVDNPVLENLVARINAWWVMIGVLGIAFYFGQLGVTILFFFISFYALREFLTLVPTRNSDYPALFAAFYFALPMQYFLIGISWYSLWVIFIPVYLFLLLPILSSLGGDTARFLE